MSITLYYTFLLAGSFLAVYIWAAFLCAKKIRKAFEKGGMWEHEELYFIDTALVFIPLLNIIWLYILTHKEQKWEEFKASQEQPKEKEEPWD
jgi:hypothetical protein